MSLRRLFGILTGIILIPSLLAACNKNGPEATVTPSVMAVTESATDSPEPTITPIPPTATQVPLAALVNGEEITLAEYQAEVARYQASVEISGTNFASDSETIVLNELIDQTLLAQAAAKMDYRVDDQLLQTRIDALASQLGGFDALKVWQDAHGYSEEEFRSTLKRAIGAAWMRDQIINAVPATAEEVHVLQILVPTKQEADQLYEKLQSGTDFMEVASEASAYNPLTKGDLGWFPRGYLDDKLIEEAAFRLQAGEHSTVIETQVGFHILYLVERDPEHTLQPDARRALQVKAIQDWLSEHRKQSEIQVLVP